MLATDLNTFWNTAACSWRKRMPQHLCVIIKNYVKHFDGEKVQFSWRKISKERTCNFWKQDPMYQMSLVRLSNFKYFLILLQLVQLHGIQQEPAFLHGQTSTKPLVSPLQAWSQMHWNQENLSSFSSGTGLNGTFYATGNNGQEWSKGSLRIS